MEDQGTKEEEPQLPRAKKARVLRIQDELDRSSEPLIGEYICPVPSFMCCIQSCNFVVSLLDFWCPSTKDVCMKRERWVRKSVERYGIVEFNVPLDTV